MVSRSPEYANGTMDNLVKKQNKKETPERK